MSSHMTVKAKQGKYPLSLNIQYFAEGEEAKISQQIADGFAAIKEADAKREQEIKRFGEETQETKTQLSTLNDTLTELQKQMNDIAAKNNRAYTPQSGAQTEEQKRQSEAFYQFMRKGRAGLSTEQVQEIKALVADDEGHILIPEELDKEIIRLMPETAIFRNLVNTRPTSASKIRKRAMNEVQVGWGKIETSAKRLPDFESDLNPTERFIYVENLNGLTKIGLDELEDTDVQLMQYLSSSFAQAAAEAEDWAVLRGRGHQFEEPEGILTTTGIARYETAVIGGLSADDLIKLMYQVKAGYRKNGTFVLPSYVEMLVRTLKNDSGDYIWQPALTAGTPNQLLGRPVYTQDDFDTFGEGIDQAVFGDFRRGYTIADRSGTSIQRLNELYIEDDLIGFKFKKRLGGGVDRKEAFAALKVKGTV